MQASFNQDPNRLFKIRRADKISQLVIQQIGRAEFQLVEQLDETKRGKAAFRSSGITWTAVKAKRKS